MQISNFSYDRKEKRFYVLSSLDGFAQELQHFGFNNKCLFFENDNRVYSLVQSNMHTATCPVYVYKHEDTYVAILKAFDEHDKFDCCHSYIVFFELFELADVFCEMYLLLR